jgi:hypothetical protein
VFVQFHYNFKSKNIAHVTSCCHLLREILARIPVNIFAKLKKHISSNKSVPEACTLLLSLKKLLVLGLTTDANIKIELLA